MEIEIINQIQVFSGYRSVFVRLGHICRNYSICMACLSCEPDELVCVCVCVNKTAQGIKCCTIQNFSDFS